MTPIHLRPKPDRLPLEATARYRPDDYSLIVGPHGEVPTAASRASIDTLTLSFSAGEHILLGLDAYTNTQRWERQPLAHPPADHGVALRSTDDFNDDGIAQSGSGPVRYVYSPTTSLLLIRIGGGRVAIRIRGLECATFGLGAAGELLEIWVQGIEA